MEGVPLGSCGSDYGHLAGALARDMLALETATGLRAKAAA